MNHKIVELSDFNVVGMEYVGKNENEEIGAMWEVFLERQNEIEAPNNAITYGVSYHMDMSGNISYIAGLKVATVSNLPNGMKSILVPAGKFAVFTYKGDIKDISNFWNQIYSQYLPELKLQPANRIPFEYYDERFCQDGELYIYIPIE